MSRMLGPQSGWPIEFMAVLSMHYSELLMRYQRAGLTVTQTWNTANILDSKVELSDSLAKGLKAEGIFSFLPATQNKGAKFNLHFKQSNFHGRAFFDLLKGPTANVDAVLGHEGFLAGASAGYDVNKAAVTSYSAAVGYTAPFYSAAVTASDNLTLFAASYYHKVNSQVEAGAKATWNSKTGNAVGLELATKYRIDPVSFAKVCSRLTLPCYDDDLCADLCTSTGQDQRPRCRCHCLQRPAARGCHPWSRPLIRYPEAGPGHPQGELCIFAMEIDYG
jgi:voltage-dependent anion channel protein 2